MKLQRFFALLICFFLVSTVWAQIKKVIKTSTKTDDLKASFAAPPDSVRPGVYWYFMDGNLSREGMTKDLESMKKAGIGNVLFLEVNIGVPRGPIDFMSEQWQELFKHAVNETKRLGMTFTLGIGPGWSGSGGPWVKPSESMQHLVFSVTEISGPTVKSIRLPKPDPRKPFFGTGTLTDDLKKEWLDYYEDAFVLAFPSPAKNNKLQDIDEKALYYRAPFSSQKGVKPFLPEPLSNPEFPVQAAIDSKQIIDLTKFLQKDGTLNWKAPAGKWTIMRFGSRNNGAVTRPAPYPGLGFECDKFDTVAFQSHLDQYVGKLLKKVDIPQTPDGAGWNMLHMDSWEMGAQNWTTNFRKEFQKRRGYDPLLYFPVYSGQVVGNTELSERFLWDLRQTSQELVVENHALYLKKYGRKYGFRLSVEPYDMNPCADFDLGSVADVPMCEFWSKGFGFKTVFSCLEASSIANIIGAPVVGAESFTAESWEAWKLYPGVLKNQGDWAFSTGVNHFVYHTFAHKPLDERYQPGMTMGPYGVHWDRSQTWWPMASAYHTYISRCSHLLQQGRKVADILYLIPEGAPHVFLPPASAMDGNDTIPDHKGYNFDGCSAQLLISKASVSNKKIVFPGGASYQVLVLPNRKTMTPALLDKIALLVRDGATVIGNPPAQSPSLVGYPHCDAQIQKKALSVWQSTQIPAKIVAVKYGKGIIYRGGNLNEYAPGEIYPSYEATKTILEQMKVAEDFTSTGELRYIHKTLSDKDIYFVSNRTDKPVQADCTFRIAKGFAELWDPISGKSYLLSQTKAESGTTSISLDFDRFQSYFVVFSETANSNLPAFKSPLQTTIAQELTGDWQLAFDPRWGGPESITFSSLDDWSKRPEEGIKYYSGIATYKKTFTYTGNTTDTELSLDLGEVNNMARVRLNGTDLGILWTSPWRLDISSTVKTGENQLEVEVANLWANRLIGDENYPDDGVKDKKWPEWLLNNQPRPSQRYTFTTHRYYKKGMPLLKSGLLGPVRILKSKN